MKRAALLIMLASCGFAQKHPGVTVGIVSGSIGFGACGISVEKLGTCSAIGAVAGLALGGITGLVTLVADTSAHELPPFVEEEDEAYVRRRVKTQTAPPPGPTDPDAPPDDTSAPTPDAGTPSPEPAAPDATPESPDASAPATP